MRHRSPDTNPVEESELEKRVDRLMDPNIPEIGKASTSIKPNIKVAQASNLPPLDIFKDNQMAPTFHLDTVKTNSQKIGDNIEKVSLAEAAVRQPDNPTTIEASEPFADQKTDAAAEDIMLKESEPIFNDEDEKVQKPSPKQGPTLKQKLVTLLKKWRLWLVVLLLIIIAIAGVPYSRYKIAGLFIKQTFTIQLEDSTTHTPVTGAKIILGGISATTNNFGIASINTKVGPENLTISKQYYSPYSGKIFNGFNINTDSKTVLILATGRQVPVKVVNVVSGLPVAGADVRILDTKATTNQSGTAVIVLPANQPTQSGEVDASGFNTTNITAHVTSQVLPDNTFSITPAGRIFYLSKQGGDINVVSSNLDGSNQQTVLAGTGSEDPNDTILSASHDWDYLALLSKRNGGQSPSLYLINTTQNNQLTAIDNSDSEFQIIGWLGHDFIYQVNRPTTPAWQSGASSLESYDADSGKLITLVNSSATGSSNADAEYQSITGATLMGNSVIYTTTWYSYPSVLNVSGQQDDIVSINPDGSSSKTLKAVDASQYYIGDLSLVEPNELNFVVLGSGGSSSSGYQLGSSGTITPLTNYNSVQNPPAFLISPSGNHTLWSQQINGKVAISVGDNNGQNAKIISTLSTDYTTYGWYTDNYLLISYKGSTLYVLAANGSGQPLKSSSYFASPGFNTTM